MREGRGRARPARRPGRTRACAAPASSDSEALGSVEDLQPGSSPTTAMAPPVRETPTKLPWRSASAARSRPGALPYHMAQHAVVAGAGQRRGQLAPPRRGGAELLVEARHVADVVLGAQLAAALELLVETAQRRALIAGHERGGVQPARRSARCWSSGTRTSALHAREEDRPSSRRYLSSSDTSRRAARRRSPVAAPGRRSGRAGGGGPGVRAGQWGSLALLGYVLGRRALANQLTIDGTQKRHVLRTD